MTPREAQVYRRASDHPWYWQLIHFLGAPLVDSWTGLSLTRFLAIYFCVLVGQDTVIQKHGLDWVDFCILLLAAAVAFGKHMLERFLGRVSIGVAGQQTQTTIDATIREIQERRGSGDTEPTP